VLCWIIFGFKSAFLCLLISVPLVGVLGPFAGGWVGAIMKSVASVWMFAIPAFFTWRMKKRSLLNQRRIYAFLGVLAIIVRVMAAIVFNLYFALPFFFGMTYEDIIWFFSNPNFLSFFGTSLGLIGLGAFFAEIAFWNTIQGIIDVYLSFVIGKIISRRVPEIAD
jgi:riboflavin transporter FmnP